MNDIEGSVLKTDLYELTMAAGYFQNKVDLKATFELYAFRLPENRTHLIAAGLEQVVDFILNLRFRDDEIAFLKGLPAFKSVSEDFFSYLRDFKFTGDLYAVPEGTVVFAREPLLQVYAPIIEAQILETFLLSSIHIQTLVATKAARIVQAASIDGKKREVVDFGSRRAHGPEAAVLAARAAYIAGCIGTSNLYAGRRFGIPVYGTMAHSWVEAFDSEREAFANYKKVFPESTVLLLDTYDTLSAARSASEFGKSIKGVRLDSGDLALLSKKARRILDRAGLGQVKIIASGSLNEYKIRNLIRRHSPIDIFGVGTEMVTSSDAPAIELVYKLVEIEKPKGKIESRAKSSPGKPILPGRKQIFRRFSSEGAILEDTIDLFSRQGPSDTQALLEPIISNGSLVKGLPSLKQIRKTLQKNLSGLPAHFKGVKIGVGIRSELRKFKESHGSTRPE